MSTGNKIREVYVLCPNGRRVNIKTSVSTSIGQIIEEACVKQKFDPYNYNLKHLRRLLDPSNTLQYSNIPNHAQLELIEASERRTEGSVTVNLVTETGQRLIADFPSISTLWDILVHHESETKGEFVLPTPSSGMEPFIVYTMRKIIGEEIKSVTLKSLGLFSGRCMLRYNVQCVFLPGNSGPAQSSPIVIVKPKVASDTPSTPHKVIENAEIENGVKQEALEEEWKEECPGEEMECEPSVEDSSLRLPSPQQTVQMQETVVVDRPPPPLLDDAPVQQKDIKVEPDFKMGHEESSEHQNLVQEKPKPTPKIIPLSDHDSVLFSLDDAPSSVRVAEETDDFFDLTVDEVKGLYREHVRELRQMEEAPLMTNQLRQLEKDSRLLTAMNRYPVTQVRICFPDRHVIQANFKPHDTIKNVMDFVTPLLASPSLDFYLYTTFPRTILSPELMLVDAGCIPKARLYLGTSQEGVSFLSTDTLAKKSSFEGASSTVITAKKKAGISSLDSHEVPSKPLVQDPSSSFNQPQGSITNNAAASSKQQKPKWFKLGK